MEPLCSSEILKYTVHLDLLSVSQLMTLHNFCLFDFLLYVPSTSFQLCRDRSSWVESVLS